MFVTFIIFNNFLYFRSHRYGERDLKSIVQVLEEKKGEYEAKGITLLIKDDPMIVAVITPIMKRAHSQNFAKEIVFIDSSGSCDQVKISLLKLCRGQLRKVHYI